MKKESKFDIALFMIGHEIEALNIFNTLFGVLEEKIELAYYILQISISNKREISKDVLKCARTSENAHVLALTSCYYENVGEHEEAKELILRALLRKTDNSNRGIEGQFINIQSNDSKADEIEINAVDANTAVQLRSTNSQEERMYCIYLKKVLPYEPFIWENAEHIYKETSIKKGLFRKKVSDEIEIDGRLFSVEKIEPIDAYFWGICMRRLVDSGAAKMLKIPCDLSGNVDAEQFTKVLEETVGDSAKQTKWLEQYKNMSELPATFNYYSKYVRATYSQLIGVIAEDPKIFFREETSSSDNHKKEYLLTYASLVILQKIGFNNVEGCKFAIIPESLKHAVDDETEKIIQDNNREHVASLGVYDGKTFINESTEEEKNKQMQDAVALKELCGRFETRNNFNDLQNAESAHKDIKTLLGIVDYDAIVLAKNTGRTLVTVEPLITALASIPEISATTTCIVDFLTNTCSDVFELLQYIKKLVNYRFVVPFTNTVIDKLANEYEDSEQDKRTAIIDEWREILRLPCEDSGYKKILMPLCRDIFAKQINNGSDTNNQVLDSMIMAFLAYGDYSVELSMSEDGQINAEIVKSNSDCLDVMQQS